MLSRLFRRSHVHSYDLAPNEEGALPASPPPRQLSQRALFLSLSAIFFFTLLFAHKPVKHAVTASQTAIKELVHPGSTTLTSNHNQTLAQFLSTRISSNHVWLTVAGTTYIREATPHLQGYVKSVNDNSPNQLQVVVICLDVECLKECDRQGWYGYGGYTLDKQKEEGYAWMYSSLYAKLRGILDALNAGYSITYSSGDVFFRRDYYSLANSMEDSGWNIQMERDVESRVSTKFFIARSVPEVINAWQAVWDESVDGGGEEQELFNEYLLKDENLPNPTLKVDIFPSSLVYGFHEGFHYPTEVGAVTMTCFESLFQRVFVAGTIGFLRDIGHYFTNPPSMLTVASMSGTPEQLTSQITLILHACKASNRAFLPPLLVSVLSPENTLHQQYIWNVFKLEDLSLSTNVRILEPHYLSHSTLHLLPQLPSTMVAKTLYSLQAHAQLDLSRHETPAQVFARLGEPALAHSKVVEVVGRWFYNQDESKGVVESTMCENSWEDPICGQTCR